MSLYKVGPIWYVDIQPHQGPRIRRSTGTADKTEAQRIHDELRADAWKRERAGAYLSDALILWLKSGERSRNEKNAIKQFRAIYSDRPISEITGADMADALGSKGPATANRTINILRAALNLAHEHKLCGPAPKIPRRKPPTGRLRWLTRAEWAALYTELPPHLKPIALFAVSTGLRAANVFGLRWDQIDMGRRVAWVAADETKAGKAHGLPLSDDAMRALASVSGQHPTWVFVYRGRPITTVKTAYRKALARAGLGQWETDAQDSEKRRFVPNTTWHDLRHTWASWHVQAGTPLAVLKELGGWASMDMVMRYSHLAPDHLGAWANNATGTSQFTSQQNEKSPENRIAPVAQWIEQPPPKGTRAA